VIRKIAIIVEADAFDRKGLFNAVLGRVSAMHDSGVFNVDFWCIQSQDDILSRHVRHRVKPPMHCRELLVEGVKVRLIWNKFSYIDAILYDRCHEIRPSWNRYVRHTATLFKDYDFISAHSLNAASLAASTGLPFSITWHGSDIHTHPFRNKAVMRETHQLMKLALCNIFVSQQLLDISDKICKDCRKVVSRNGVSSIFITMNQDDRRKIREHYGIKDTEKAIGYAGNFMKVKNVEALPAIFSSIYNRIGNCVFFCAGDGKLKAAVEQSMNVPCTFLGNVQTREMNNLFNALDVLIVPSLKEGFSLVCAEALMCGCKVAGSCVGAIPQIIGEENTADPLDVNYIEELTDITERLLRNDARAKLCDDYSWKAVVAQEEKLFKSLMTDKAAY